MEPRTPLSTAQLDRYSRPVLLPDVGESGRRRLRNARVAVTGAGGPGSPILAHLVVAGVASIGVIDLGVVESSHLQRQTVPGTADVGRPKVDSAVDAGAAIDPSVDIRAIPARLAACHRAHRIRRPVRQCRSGEVHGHTRRPPC